VAPSADLVLWSRLGSVYDPGELRDAVDERRVIDRYGLLRPAEVPGEPYDVGDVGEPAVVEGVKGEWRVDPAYLDGHPFAGLARWLDLEVEGA
jgi:hypothetical protein